MAIHVKNGLRVTKKDEQPRKKLRLLAPAPHFSKGEAKQWLAIGMLSIKYLAL